MPGCWMCSPGGGRRYVSSISWCVSTSLIPLKIMRLPTLSCCMQVRVPGLQARRWHSATAFTLCPGLIEVTIFGGCPKLPSNVKIGADIPQIANTTVLRFGESTMHACTFLACLRLTTTDHSNGQSGNLRNGFSVQSAVPLLEVPSLESGS